MQIALIEDDRTQALELSEMLRRELSATGQWDCTVDFFENGETFLAQWKPQQYEIIILDIFMDQLTGVEVSRRIREADSDVSLVFCSTSNEFAVESYEVNARYYLHKPVTREGIRSMLLRLNPLELAKSLTLPDGHRILLRQILYTNYFNHVITLYFRTGELYRLRSSQAELEELLLPFSYFFSPIKGMIVNFYEVTELAEDSFVMSNGKAVPITRRKYRQARDAYTRFHFETMRREMAAGTPFSYRCP